jgi:hypothetical protein
MLTLALAFGVVACTEQANGPDLTTNSAEPSSTPGTVSPTPSAVVKPSSPTASSPTASSPTVPSPTAPISTASIPAESVVTEPGPTPSTVIPGDDYLSAAALLAALPVKGRAPKTGYSRARFGQTWSDDVNVDGGHDGCDTRNDMLRRDLVDTILKPGTRECVVLSGTLHDPYSGDTVAFDRTVDAAAVQIDHVVALSNAWQTGAQQLSAERRQDLANDPANLQATTRAMNQQKGDGDAATWLPPVKSFRCTYVSRQITVKAIYHLWVTAAEREAMARVLAGCGATVPTTALATTTTAGSTGGTVRPVLPSVASVGTTAPTGDVYYARCAEAWAAGAAPLYRGQPGYRPGLDGDRDGIACETPPR